MTTETLTAKPEDDPEPARVRWLNLVPGAWLVFVAVGVGLLAVFGHGLATAASGDAAGLDVMSWAERTFPLVERAYLPLLCLLGVAAIIRYFCLRNGRTGPGPADAAPDRIEGQNTT